MKNNSKNSDIPEITLGWQITNGKRYFDAGNCLISEQGVENFDNGVQDNRNYCFEYDSSINEKEAIEYFLSVMKITPSVTSIVAMTGILGVLRQPMRDAGIPLPSPLYLLAPTQSMKTTVSVYATCLFNRNNLQSNKSTVCLRTSSTNIALEEHSARLKDLVFIVDDLFREHNAKIFNENENHVINLLRNYADDTPRATQRNAYLCNSQLIITGEYLLNGNTNIGRIFLVEFDEAVNSARLSKCQEQPLALSTFYMYFITWLCREYDKIVENIKNAFANYRKRQDVSVSKFGRLNEQLFFYMFAFDVLVEFAAPYIELVSNTRQSFYKYILSYIQKQNAIMVECALKEKSIDNLSLELLHFIDCKQITVGKKGDDCFIKGEYMYIRNSYFSEQLYSTYQQSISTKKIAAYFRERFISESYSDNRPKKYNNRCYLKLKLKALQDDARKETFNHLFFKP